MFKIHNLTVKNFMSVGNQTQAVDFDRNDLTLVLGENLDTGGGDSGSRNGTGKTTIINALCYGLYGVALTNIRKDNLINKTNGKHMLVCVDFEHAGTHYRIERGRKPNVLKLYVNEHERETGDDNSQGDSRETQQEIERILQMSPDMFKHIVALNTYTEPFLSMRSNDQRAIIEQLLGITQLSEKAENLKELVRETREQIQTEEFRIKSVIDANNRITEQIENLQRKQKLWHSEHKRKIQDLQTGLEQLAHVDIDHELAQHKRLSKHQEHKKAISEAQRWIDSIQREDSRLTKLISKLENEIASLQNNTCYACGQELHNTKQDEILAEKQQLLQETAVQALTSQTQAQEHSETLANIGDPGAEPEVFYSDINDAYNHRSTVDKLAHELEIVLEQKDPYTEQILEMQESAIEQVNYDTLNELVKIKDHQEFLQKLLTNKDSFIRKRIIDQNLAYLNTRLAHYLNRTGLPHQVEFRNDLSVEITELGRELDFDNLSRGERNRLILSLSWSFRDVWENLYQSINLLFIDELVDSGMDSNGVDSALGVLKQMSRERNKSIWLVSHKDELTSRVHNIMKVIKENGFTSYNEDIDIV